MQTEQQTVELSASVLESSTEYSIIGTDMEGNIVLWNEGARRIYGYDHDEVVGKENASILHIPENIAKNRPGEMRTVALETGKWEGTIERRRKNGVQFAARVVLTPRLDSSGSIIGFLLISKDISDEKRLTTELEFSNYNLRGQIEQREKTENELRESHEQLRFRAEELATSASDMKKLVELSEVLQSCDSSEEVQLIIEEYLQKIYPTDSGCVYLSREFGSLVEIFARWNGAHISPKELFEPRDCWALRRARPHLVEDLSKGVKCGHLQNVTEGGAICVPMRGLNQILGLLHISWTNTSVPQGSCRAESWQTFAAAVADMMGLAISNVRLREKLKDQSIRDPLTQLYNRRYLEDSLNREVSRARRAGADIGIIMIDIDNFKQFNDSFGHPSGDELLRTLGTYLKSSVRPEDIPSRYGGEEFTLIMPGACCEIVSKRAETLRTGFRGIQLDRQLGSDNALVATSLSLGVAVFPEHGTSAAEIIRVADEALYIAKTGGKDRVVVATNKTPVTLGKPSEKLLIS